MLDFQKRKKKYYELILHDGTMLLLPTPTMEMFETMKEVGPDPRKVEKEQLYAVIGAILRDNKYKIEISDEQVQTFDYEDMYALLSEYLQFVNEVLSDPNSRSPLAL